MRALLLLLALAVALGSAHPTPAATESDSLRRRTDEVFSDLDRTISPGCSLAVVRGGDVAYTRGYGMANLEHGIALGSDSVFRIASTSKQFTAATVALLAEEGRLSLDDDIRRWLPEMPDYGKPVTVRHLIHHTSGIRDYLTLAWLAGFEDSDSYTPAQSLAMIARQRALNFPPGSEYLYSNSGYFLLSQIAERAGKVPLRESAERLVFGPLGMRDTHFHDDHRHPVPRRASGYAPTAEGAFLLSQTTLDHVGDGGVYTTVLDLARWDANFYDNRLGRGGPALIERLQTPATLDNGSTTDYGFGLLLGERNGRRTIGHAGDFVGYRAEMRRYPDDELTVICLCNLATARPVQRAAKVADIWLGLETPKEAAAREGASTPGAPTLELGSAELAAYAGTFHSPELGADYRLAIDEDELRLFVADREPVSLAPVEPDVFAASRLTLRFERQENRPVAFALDAGRVRGVHFDRRD